MPEIIEVAVQTAREAGAVLREGYGKPLEILEVTQHDIKLATDRACEELIRDRILSAFPDHAILGEEEGGAISAEQPTWVVDPLDGTSNYSRRLPHFCTSIGVQQGETLLAGVVYDPMRDELFTATAGGGAYLNGTRIAVSDVDLFERAVVAMGFAKSAASRRRGLVEIREISRKIHKVRILGAAALDMAYVACGRLDAFIEHDLYAWDVAAATLLIREAGGTVELDSAGKHRWHVHAHNGKLW
jgi:myo-inositol-1(or 4)-monophosphatase